MQLLTRAPTRQYFISIFIVVSALFFTFSAVIYRHYDNAQRLNQWTLYNYELARQSRRILMSLVDMESSVRGYFLSGEKTFLAPYQNSQKMLQGYIRQLRYYTINDSDSHHHIDVWLEKIEALSTLLNTQVATLQNQGNAAFSTIDLGHQKQQMDELRTLLEDYIGQHRQEALKQTEKLQEQQRNFKYTLILGTILAIGVMLLATLVILALIRRSHTAEEEAREIESRFLTVITGIDDGLYDFNPTDGTIYYSPSYKAMLGYTDEELPNTIEIFNSIIHPEDYERVWDDFRKYQEGKTESYSNVFRLRHKDGGWVWVLSRGVGLRDKKGKMTRFIGTHTNVTEQKNREQELERLSKEMETFTYITSHDLRAPLVNLKGFAGEMQRAIDKAAPILRDATLSLKEENLAALRQIFEDDIQESLRFIVQSVEKMDALTTAVLDLSRIGKREYRAETVDTQAIVQRCLDTLGYEVSQKNIEVVCETLPVIVSDPLAIEQIFSNVLDNAVKYLDPGRKGKIHISATEQDNHVIFRIEDNGRGISEADKDKVFQIFRRARNTVNIRGRGMGMTFTQATLRKLGGAIWFDSVQDKGTTFYISFPHYPATQRYIL